MGGRLRTIRVLFAMRSFASLDCNLKGLAAAAEYGGGGNTSYLDELGDGCCCGGGGGAVEK